MSLVVTTYESIYAEEPFGVTTDASARDELKRAFLTSYETAGGINHIDGSNLPDEASINSLACDFMHLLFPGFFQESRLRKSEVPGMLDELLEKIETKLKTEVVKCLRFGGSDDIESRSRRLTRHILARMPDVRRILQTDVTAAYEGDPAARSIEEIILSYPFVLAIALQRIAHILYRCEIPLLPRMLTEFAHERTGADIHPGAQIGTYFFIDHCTGVVIGETARIGSHVKIYQGVTLGAKSFAVDGLGHPIKGVKRHPELQDNVIVYPGASILGGDTVIGENSIVGANVWIMQSMPPNSIAYYRGDISSIIRPRENKESMLSEFSDWMI